MTLAAHAAIGAAIGISVGNPALAFLFGFISHFIADAIPHGDSAEANEFWSTRKVKKSSAAIVVIDAIVAMFVILWLASSDLITPWGAFTWGIVGGLLPDLLVGLYEWKRIDILKSFNRFHADCHNFFTKKHGDIPLHWSLVAQFALIIFIGGKI